MRAAARVDSLSVKSVTVVASGAYSCASASITTSAHASAGEIDQALLAKALSTSSGQTPCTLKRVPFQMNHPPKPVDVEAS